MKIRNGFVSNSSSTAFMITNLSKSRKTLADFVEENPQLIGQYREQYCRHLTKEGRKRYTYSKLLASARAEKMVFEAGERKYCVFGDEQGTLVGQVFDYILREGGQSESFVWKFEEWLR